MQIECFASDQALEWVKYQLSLLPAHLINIFFSSGMQILIYNNFPTIVYKGYVNDADMMLEDGRNLTRTSHFSPQDWWIYIYEPDLFIDDGAMSVVHHEFGHAIDMILGIQTYYSFENPTLFKEGTPLDWYAAKNSIERFATCFDAFSKKEELLCPTEFDHTVKDLSKKEPEIFLFLQQLWRGL
jgi:hypothetical protein